VIIIILLVAILICMPFFRKAMGFVFGLFCLYVTLHWTLGLM
jgi:hypothetical protein